MNGASTSPPAAAAISPLPRRYLADGPGIGGVIKARPEDFLVEELPLYELTGAGEHLYLFVEKIGVSHTELIASLQRHFKVGYAAIGFAGMKDKMAVTRQLVSLHTRADPADMQPHHERIRVLWTTRHGNKLRRGHLLGNRFSIRVRNVDPLQAPLVQRTLRLLERRGVPNYFGEQRFGYRRNNHILGAALLREQWDALLAELLGSRGSPFPEYQRHRRECFDSGAYAEAAAAWAAPDHAERAALRALIAGRDHVHACRAVRPTDTAFWLSAVQSAVFNRVLDDRLDAGTFDRLLQGDLAWRHDRRHVFAVIAEELANPDLAPRVASLELSPSGPLWGPGMTRAGGNVDQCELAAISSAGLERDVFLKSHTGFEGERRPLRALLRNHEIDAGLDEHGPYIRVAFDLDRGAYATIALREIMKTASLEQHDDQTA